MQRSVCRHAKCAPSISLLPSRPSSRAGGPRLGETDLEDNETDTDSATFPACVEVKLSRLAQQRSLHHGYKSSRGQSQGVRWGGVV